MKVTCCSGWSNKHSLSPRCHMTRALGKSRFEACSHAHRTRPAVSMFVDGCERPLIRPELALAAVSSCHSAPTPGSAPVDADEVAAALLSRRAEVYLDALPGSGFPSHCFHRLKSSLVRMPIRNKGLVVFSVSLLLAHQLCGQDCTGAVESHVEGRQTS